MGTFYSTGGHGLRGHRHRALWPRRQDTRAELPRVRRILVPDGWAVRRRTRDSGDICAKLASCTSLAKRQGGTRRKRSSASIYPGYVRCGVGGRRSESLSVTHRGGRGKRGERTSRVK